MHEKARENTMPMIKELTTLVQTISKSVTPESTAIDASKNAATPSTAAFVGVLTAAFLYVLLLLYVAKKDQVDEKIVAQLTNAKDYLNQLKLKFASTQTTNTKPTEESPLLIV